MKNAPIEKINESAKKQDHSITVTGQGEPRIDSRLLARHLGKRHKSMMALIDRYKNHLKELNQLTFKKEVGERSQGGGNPLTFALLTEDQCYFLLNLSRNSEKVVNLKLRLAQAFKEARQARSIHQDEYLPTYHHLHDAISRLAGDSSGGRFAHLNINRAINKTVGVESGGRHGLGFPSKSMLAVAQLVASNALADANNHKDGYERAKQALSGLKQALDFASNDPALISSKGGGHE